MGRDIATGSVVLMLLLAISWVFWEYTLKDYMPTQLPQGYQEKKVGETITVEKKLLEKPVFYHFFNPQCPCSRFNISHVKWLIEHYQEDIDFKIVLQVRDSAYNWQELEEELNLKVPYIIDDHGYISKAFGVYATPQAALLTAGQKLYYRGNYNRAKYCTDPRSSFARQAIDSLLLYKPAPLFGIVATQAYGCQLPQKTFLYETTESEY